MPHSAILIASLVFPTGLSFVSSQLNFSPSPVPKNKNALGLGASTGSLTLIPLPGANFKALPF